MSALTGEAPKGAVFVPKISISYKCGCAFDNLSRNRMVKLCPEHFSKYGGEAFMAVLYVGLKS